MINFELAYLSNLPSGLQSHGTGMSNRRPDHISTGPSFGADVGILLRRVLRIASNLFNIIDKMRFTPHAVLSLQNALDDCTRWRSGRKRFQISSAATDPMPDRDVVKFMVGRVEQRNGERLKSSFEGCDPRHQPVDANGELSVLGCRPWSGSVRPGEDPLCRRARSRDRSECGIPDGPDGNFIRVRREERTNAKRKIRLPRLATYSYFITPEQQIIMR